MGWSFQFSRGSGGAVSLFFECVQGEVLVEAQGIEPLETLIILFLKRLQ